MSGASLLPVGGYATLPALKSALAMRDSHSVYLTTLGVTTTKVWLIGSVNTATTGLQAPAALHITKLSCAGHCSAQVGTPTISATVWQVNQSAGSEIITATSAAVATGVGIAGWSSTTIVNSGKDAVAANVAIILSIESAATSATILSLNVRIQWTWD